MLEHVVRFVRDELKQSGQEGLELEADFDILHENKHSVWYTALWTDGITCVMIIKADKDGKLQRKLTAELD